MDHDRLFKELLTTFFADFLDLFLPEMAAYLDRAAIEFLDKEVFTDVTAGAKHEADLVAKARFRGKESFFDRFSSSKPLHYSTERNRPKLWN